jgi:hypothetical protein
MVTTMAMETTAIRVTLYFALVMESGKVIMCDRGFTETDTEFIEDEPCYEPMPKLMNGQPSRRGYYRTPEEAVAFRVDEQRKAVETAKAKLAGAEAGLANLLTWGKAS